MKVKEKPPLCSDELVNSIFLIIVETLKKKVKAIYLKTDLRYPDKTRQPLHGLSILDDDVIYLDNPRCPKDRAQLPFTLVHEVLHVAMPWLHCQRISKLENALWIRRTGFDERQRRFLKNIIPKYEVKHEPSLEIEQK